MPEEPTATSDIKGRDSAGFPRQQKLFTSTDYAACSLAII